MRVASYSDANTLIKECDYRKANAMLANGSYGDAQSIFESLGEYSDSMTKTEQCIYERAETMLGNKQYTDDQELYDTIDYKDSSEKAKLCAYNTASELYNAVEGGATSFTKDGFTLKCGKAYCQNDTVVISGGGTFSYDRGKITRIEIYTANTKGDGMPGICGSNGWVRTDYEYLDNEFKK